MLKKYLKDVVSTYQNKDAREESFYSSLENLLEEFIKKLNKKYFVLPLPKKTEGGNPDFRVWDGKQKIIGYIEAKYPNEENLDSIANSEQLIRYRKTFPNLILTNFFEFRLYRFGQLIDQVTIARRSLVNQLSIVPPLENGDRFLKLLENFFSFFTPRITSGKSLAIELAKKTRFLKDQIYDELNRESKEEGTQTLEAFFEAFKHHLINTLSYHQFADLFAQTITYGLFVARLRADDGFNRLLAFQYIPSTIGILKDMFRFVSSTDLPISMRVVDDIADLLVATDVKKIIEGFYLQGKGKDPIIHFYETFLAEYDPKEREKRGVYYTPEPVVQYIINSVNEILKIKFNKSDGLADKTVIALDPAAGTLTFIVAAIRLAISEYQRKYGSGSIKKFIEEHILENFYAFELMMAPYAVGHLKISLVLNEYGYRLEKDKRFNLFLTNTLDLKKKDDHLPGVLERSIAKESEQALLTKEKTPIWVIFGNPPYSGNSVNKTDFTEREMEVYKKEVDSEKNLKPLLDDYIKFIRFAHWKIERSKRGILAMITNNSYLSGLIHRGMRKKLLEDFNEIYILNLHGNTRINEKTPKGELDENVFDIRQGVAISIFIKDEKQKGLGSIYYYDLYGTRKEKYQFLLKNSIKTTQWVKLQPTPSFYFFVKKDFSLKEKYDRFTSVLEIFEKHVRGVVTSRDSFVIDWDKNILEQRINTFVNSELDDQAIKAAFNLKENDKWNLNKIRKKLKEKGINQDLFIPYLYRPFDERTIFYEDLLLERSRKELMVNLLKPNLAMLLMRQVYWSGNYSHVFVCDKVVDSRVFISNRGSADVFPLYSYDFSSKKKKDNDYLKTENLKSLKVMMLFDRGKNDYEIKKPNINRFFLAQLKNLYKRVISPEEIFYYLYAILHSNYYRNKYQEFLKIDFPRVPIVRSHSLFSQLSSLGKELVDLHLLTSSKLDQPIVKFYGEDSNKVKERRYLPDKKKLYINSNQYFQPILPAVWNFYIGGYQVLDKWLKDRKDRVLKAEEVKIFCKIISAIVYTIEFQQKIDNLYLQVDKN